MIELLSSPFQPVFRRFVDSLVSDCLICAPYITLGPARQLIASIQRKRLEKSVAVKVITDLSISSLLHGSTDAGALLEMMQTVERTQVIYLPRVHAKVYASGEKMAIVTSANMTDGGLAGNLEYGVSISDPALVRRVRADVEAYATLGGNVTLSRLMKLKDQTVRLRAAVDAEQKSISQKLRLASYELAREAEDDLLRVRVHGRSVHGVFAETILYLLARGDLTTAQLHTQIQAIHPDLCDDHLDRVIDGQHFGKLWKHQVRSAQQHLKKRGQLAYDAHLRRWHRLV